MLKAKKLVAIPRDKTILLKNDDHFQNKIFFLIKISIFYLKFKLLMFKKPDLIFLI